MGKTPIPMRTIGDFDLRDLGDDDFSDALDGPSLDYDDEPADPVEGPFDGIGMSLSQAIANVGQNLVGKGPSMQGPSMASVGGAYGQGPSVSAKGSYSGGQGPSGPNAQGMPGQPQPGRIMQQAAPSGRVEAPPGNLAQVGSVVVQGVPRAVYAAPLSPQMLARKIVKIVVQYANGQRVVLR